MASKNPGSVSELAEFMQKLYDNRAHVKSIKVDSMQKVIVIDLDFAANLAGFADFTVPLQGSRVVEAKDIVGQIWKQAMDSHAPNRAQISTLWECLDHAHP